MNSEIKATMPFGLCDNMSDFIKNQDDIDECCYDFLIGDIFIIESKMWDCDECHSKVPVIAFSSSHTASPISISEDGRVKYDIYETDQGTVTGVLFNVLPLKVASILLKNYPHYKYAKHKYGEHLFAPYCPSCSGKMDWGYMDNEEGLIDSLGENVDLLIKRPCFSSKEPVFVNPSMSYSFNITTGIPIVKLLK